MAPPSFVTPLVFWGPLSKWQMLLQLKAQMIPDRGGYC